MADYEAMAEHEIEAAKTALKGQVNSLREEMQRAESVLRRKHMAALAEQALAAAGVTGVTITPAPAELTATPGESTTEGAN